MNMEIESQQDRSTNTDVRKAATAKCIANCFRLILQKSISLDTMLIDPENPPDPPLAPFSRINLINGRLIYEDGENLETVFPLPGK